MYFFMGHQKLSRFRAGLPGYVDVPKVYVDLPKVQKFDLLCAAPGIQHSLAPPQHPQTNGMAECFNGRIKDVPQSHHFRSGEELETTLHRSVVLYNGSLQPAAAATGPGQQDRLRR
jgi:hypothetical protein